MTTPDQLPTLWRERASLFRRHGAAGQADTLEAVAAELETAVSEEQEALLNLQEAARESGYSARRLRELVSEGAVPNAGRKGAPRFRRRDLPRKAKTTSAGGYDPAQDAAELLRRI